MKRSLLFVTLFLCSIGFAVAQSASLQGKVTEAAAGEPVLFASVALYQNGVLKTGTETDFDGNYNFANLDPGSYAVEVSYLGLQTQRVEDITVFEGKVRTVDIVLEEATGVMLDEVVVREYKVPLVEQDNTTQGGTLTSDQIRNLPTRNINALAATTAGLGSADEGDAITVRGSRSDATNYYVDGMRVQGNLIPESEIDQLQVITGGVEARYGDVTGGIISITTKGPSDKFSGGLEAETSQYLDPYNNNLVGVNLSGPILRNKKGVSVLGFRFGGRYTYNEDDDPSAVPVYRVKDEVLAELEANPVILRNGQQFVAADYLLNEDVDVLETRPFEDFTRYSATAKIDARFSDAIDVTLTGAYNETSDRFTPSENSATGASWRTLNSHNNPYNNRTDTRLNFRFRHRLGGAVSGDDGNKKVSTVQNASYTLQGSYENRLRDQFDPRHQDNYFDYGYVGRFDVDYVPVFAVNADELGNAYLDHVDYREVLRGYDPTNSPNPILANYNNPLGLPINETLNPDQPAYAIRGFDAVNNTTIEELNVINGRVSNLFQESWGFHRNVGGIYNTAFESDQDIIIFNANAQFDLVPGGSDKGRHNIQLGIAYEQRTNRQYFVRDPRRLWQAARQYANAHIQGINADAADTLGTYTSIYGEDLPDPFFDAPILSLTLQEPQEARFYREVRRALGIEGLDNFVNTDGLTPDQLSLDMFSAQELNDQFILDYFGYDYLGNEFNGTFDDFFTVEGEDGVRTFPVAPARPLYASAYIQDKFTFRDIIFRLGVRIDRYDANTKVLQDPYSLYAIQGASEFHSQFGGDRPGNIGDDYRVYTATDNGDEVRAYRNGDDWFQADGTPVNGPQEIEGIRTGLVFPKYQDPNAHEANYIKSRDYNTDASFQDYEVQVNVMPRLAFSFPISDKANFFAHYDILVQRPNSSTIATALDYFYFVERTGQQTFSNPNLRPERTVDYEVGFQQALSQSSAIKISAYYKEMRDMIQLRTFFPVPIVGQYTTFDNLDFGTVKAFSFAYDLRRTRNLQLNANYTLQFADGTGSNTESQRGLTNRGNIRNLFPLDFDERHRINVVADYRFGKEQGPRVGGAYLLANAGINFQAVAVSGRPYTAKQVTIEELQSSGTIGGINGARNPWNTTLNLRIDKNFQLAKGLGINVYLRVSNLLDTRNVIDVYERTGSPEDDGFLRSEFGQNRINQIQNSARDLNAYLASYQWRLLNSDFYSLPRRMFLGAIVNF
jgi:outer membrane receptor protein involved in Fe transport